jgi:DNA repair exonuclease SbcCD ATPase subunit
MVTEDREFEDDLDKQRDRSRATVLAAETTRSASTPPAGEKIPLFWQIFGGTILSVLALIVITAFGQLSSNETELRRDISQVQADVIHKDELNVRLDALWKSVKELQTTTASRTSLEESTGILHRDVGTRIKIDDQQRKDMQRQLDELSRRVQALAERLVSIEATHRVTDSSGVTGK